MRYRRTIVLVITMLTFVTAVQSRAQVSLYPQASAETNAMGGAGVSFISDNALATIANPAELGLFSLHGILSASYMPEIPGKLNASAVDVGLNLGEFLRGLPFKMSLGVGYSNPRYSYPATVGENFTNSVETDVANTLTIGIGLDYLVRLGLGYNLKWVTTKGGPWVSRPTNRLPFSENWSWRKDRKNEFLDKPYQAVSTHGVICANDQSDIY